MTHRVRCLLGGTLLLTALASTGCPPPREHRFERPTEARDAVANMEEHLGAPDVAIQSRALVTFKFRDRDGRSRSFIGQPATVIFESPRCLYFDIKNALAGSVARIGSNDQQYWIYIDLPEQRQLWYGTWDALLAGAARRMIVAPNDLLDSMLVGGVPLRIGSGPKPLLETDPATKKRYLLYLDLDGRGWPFVAREIELANTSPTMPARIIDRNAKQEVLMDARFSQFRAVQGLAGRSLMLPHRYVILWPTDNAEMRLDLDGFEVRDRDLPFCEFPEGWQGPRENLDFPSVSGAFDDGDAADGRVD